MQKLQLDEYLNTSRDTDLEHAVFFLWTVSFCVFFWHRPCDFLAVELFASISIQMDLTLSGATNSRYVLPLSVYARGEVTSTIAQSLIFKGFWDHMSRFTLPITTLCKPSWKVVRLHHWEFLFVMEREGQRSLDLTFVCCVCVLAVRYWRWAVQIFSFPGCTTCNWAWPKYWASWRVDACVLFQVRWHTWVIGSVLSGRCGSFFHDSYPRHLWNFAGECASVLPTLLPLCSP